MNNLIEIADVTKVYQRGAEEVHALRGVSARIGQGEFIAVVGPSGSGKSTLLQILGCMDHPTSGSVKIMGRETSGLHDRELTALRRQTIGFVFQQFFLLPTLTALENIMLPTIFGGRSRTEQEAQDLLGLVDLKDRAQHRINELSGGQMQRVAIARALIDEPRILLADEPTGNLDSEAAERIFETFQALKSSRVTVIVVTHNMELARMADRILKIKDGRLAALDETR